MTVREESVDDLAAARDAGPVTLVDVRDPDEYAAGHVPGAISVPLTELGDRLAELPAGAGTVHVLCGGGGRSAKGAELLGEHGVDAVSVAGGTRGWIASGRDVDRGGPQR